MMHAKCDLQKESSRQRHSRLNLANLVESRRWIGLSCFRLPIAYGKLENFGDIFSVVVTFTTVAVPMKSWDEEKGSLGPFRHGQHVLDSYLHRVMANLRENVLRF